MSKSYLTVTALTKYLKRKLDTDTHLRTVWLKGEISNFKHHSRGHMYMTIKDEQARIQAVMFAGSNRFLKFVPENGMHVLVRGEVSIFEAAGQYQLYIQVMEPDGVGALYLAFEQLKEKLHKKGYFEPRYKQSLPAYPTHVGVITSPTGAAVRDIVSTIQRRFPIVRITIFPVLVQGPKAAASIAAAIEKANTLHTCDVLIVGRGGGSIEELWSFNEEIVAESIFQSEIPIISAVGHETDTTISDFTADVRAATPTGAAEIAVPSLIELKDKLSACTKTLSQHMSYILRQHQQTLEQFKQAYAFRYPAQLIRQKEQELDRLTDQLHRVMEIRIQHKQNILHQLQHRLRNQHPNRQIKQATSVLKPLQLRNNQAMERILERKTNQFSSFIDKLTILNPLDTMKRGFAIPYQSDGNLLKSVKEVNRKDQIVLKILDGELDCLIQDLREEKE